MASTIKVILTIFPVPLKGRAGCALMLPQGCLPSLLSTQKGIYVMKKASIKLSLSYSVMM
ncbi:MAG: hypothetical protein C0177_07265 [Fervidicoccus fontis]|nr:MAG: hypothetical protein C0177_07265 [Fervidicoccus fontis]